MNQRKLTEKVLEIKWEYEKLKELVDRMNDKFRLVLILRYFNDLKNDEIADILSIPVGTVKSRIHNALRKIRKQMGSVNLDTKNGYR